MVISNKIHRRFYKDDKLTIGAKTNPKDKKYDV